MFRDAAAHHGATVDVQISVVGNRLVGADVFSDGTVSCLRSNLGTYKSPEHAEVMREIMFEPQYALLLATGKVTEEFIENVVTTLREQRAAAQSNDDV